MSASRYKNYITLLATAALLMVGSSAAHAEVIYDDGVYSAADACRGAVGQSFYDALSPHGQWRYGSRYGWVWSPYRSAVGVSFRPYLSAGHWVHSTEGWMFVSNHSWGWVPFHYGRWYRDAIHGWSWVPGAQWAPAWVDWRYGEGMVGWAPLGPADVYLADHWYYVESGYLGHPRVTRYIVSRDRSRRLFRRTRRVRRAQRRWSSGPPLRVVTGHRRAHPVQRVRVRAPASGVVARVRGSGASVTVQHRGRVSIRRHYGVKGARGPRYNKPAPGVRAPRGRWPVPNNRNYDEPTKRGPRYSKPAPTTRAPRGNRTVPNASGYGNTTRGPRYSKPASTTRAPRGNRTVPNSGYGNTTRGPRYSKPASTTRAPRTSSPRRNSYERKQPPSRYKKLGPTHIVPPKAKRNKSAKRSSVQRSSKRNATRRVNDDKRKRRRGR